MDELSRSIEVSVDDLSISCTFKSAGQESIVFIHGFGASKGTFLEVFERKEFQSFTLLAMDLIGFGDSNKPDNFSYQMKDQARILRKMIDFLDLDCFHIVAHSMGGIIGIELSEMIPSRVLSFTNAEGNITVDDCTMSKRVEEMGEEHFAQKGFDQLKQAIAQESKRTQDKSLKDYLKMLSVATSTSLYKSSVSTVQESHYGDLLKRFSQLPFYKCYIYGEKNKNVFPAEELLRKQGIPLFYVSGSGHSMMKENPDEFYGLVIDTVSQCSRKRKSDS